MKVSSIFLLIMFIMHVKSVDLVYMSKIPVDKLTLFKTLLSLQSLQSDLDTNFDKTTFKKPNTFTRTLLTQSYLNAINKQIAPINNLVIGSEGDVTGNTNFIIGDKNNIKGDSNWVFSQGFNGQINKDLILDHWQVQLDKSKKILTSPKQAIKKW